MMNLESQKQPLARCRVLRAPAGDADLHGEVQA